MNSHNGPECQQSAPSMRCACGASAAIRAEQVRGLVAELAPSCAGLVIGSFNSDFNFKGTATKPLAVPEPIAAPQSEATEAPTVWLPKRGSLDALLLRGLQPTGRSNDVANEVAVPAGWSIRPSEVSPYHQHLCDHEGVRVTCIFLKTGASGTFQMRTESNCADK